MTGALIYVSPDGTTRTTIADDELIAPTGLTIGSNGDIYISNKGFILGEGEVLQIENPIVNGSTYSLSISSFETTNPFAQASPLLGSITYLNQTYV